MVRERRRVQQAIAVSAVTLPVSTGMHGAVCMAPLYVQAVVQVKGNFTTRTAADRFRDPFNRPRSSEDA